MGFFTAKGSSSTLTVMNIMACSNLAEKMDRVSINLRNQKNEYQGNWKEDTIHGNGKILFANNEENMPVDLGFENGFNQ
jgi:MORN repeat